MKCVLLLLQILQKDFLALEEIQRVTLLAIVVQIQPIIYHVWKGIVEEYNLVQLNRIKCHGNILITLSIIGTKGAYVMYLKTFITG